MHTLNRPITAECHPPCDELATLQATIQAMSQEVAQLRHDLTVVSADKDKKIDLMMVDVHQMTKEFHRMGEAFERMAQAVEDGMTTIKGLGSLPMAWNRMVAVWEFVGWLQKNALRIAMIAALLYFSLSPDGLRAIIDTIMGR